MGTLSVDCDLEDVGPNLPYVIVLTYLSVPLVTKRGELERRAVEKGRAFGGRHLVLWETNLAFV